MKHFHPWFGFDKTAGFLLPDPRGHRFYLMAPSPSGGVWWGDDKLWETDWESPGFVILEFHFVSGTSPITNLVPSLAVGEHVHQTVEDVGDTTVDSISVWYKQAHLTMPEICKTLANVGLPLSHQLTSGRLTLPRRAFCRV